MLITLTIFLHKTLALKSVKRGKSEGFDCCDRPSNLTQIGFKSSLFQFVWSWNFIDDTEKQWGMYSLLCESLCVISNPLVNYSYSPETLNSGQIWQFFVRVTLKFDGWPWKTMGYHFYTLQSPCIISKHWVNSNWSLSPETLNSGQNRRLFVPCDLEIWRMTLRNNRAPLLYYVKLCASFERHGWIQTWVTVRKRPIRIKKRLSCPVRPWNLTDDPEKQQVTSSIPCQVLCIS